MRPDLLHRATVAKARKLLRRSLFLVFTLIITVAAGLPVFVHPQVDTLRRADAILILSGPHHGRYPFGFDLAEQGWAPNLVVSNPSGTDNPRLTRYCADPHPGLTVYCFAPDPATTKGEARELHRLASEHAWRTVIVVTFWPHVSRSRYILEKCFDGELVMVPNPTPISVRRWAFEYLYQTAGYVRALLQPGC
ncbi:YdcF family protein [Mycolicibacterium bacteremicum]|uniref:YdcF family protein n=1 Tax=Mycolicibacterium bacteremicum TaxID=564198 RepID=UPI0026C5DE19|nr:YdcF family protein [Mycolicibacterium bacteremicum]